MTRKNKTKEEEKKILVIEDEREIRKVVVEARPSLFEAPETLAEAEQFLEQRKYAAILLDWRFYSFYTNEIETNGQEVAYRLRRGYYGALNQNTPYIGFSSAHRFKGEIFQHYKEGSYDEIRDSMKGLLEKIEKEGII